MIRTYAVKEVFYSLQGEGVNAGRPAVFCRFAGCNLWSGQEEDRARAACRFCDTDFVGGDRVGSPAQLALAIRQRWPARGWAFVVLTGGEPTLQADAELIRELHNLKCEVAIETNGTRPTPYGTDWITVSPKAGTDVVQRQGHELKVVWPQPGLDLEAMLAWNFRHFLLSPMDVLAESERLANIHDATTYCLTNPAWRLSLQMHKTLGLR